MSKAVCGTCGRFLKFVEDKANEETNTPEGTGHYECKKCGSIPGWAVEKI